VALEIDQVQCSVQAEILPDELAPTELLDLTKDHPEFGACRLNSTELVMPLVHLRLFYFIF
jgi:hypothetical protein